jgi:hypothetical protein
MPRPGHFTPEKDPIPIVEETGWAPLPALSDAGSLVLTGIRSPDHPVRSEYDFPAHITAVQRVQETNRTVVDRPISALFLKAAKVQKHIKLSLLMS